MGHINVKHNGQYACLSTITETLITPFMSPDDYENWRKKEYGNHFYKPVEETRNIFTADGKNIYTLKEAVETIRMNKDHDETVYNLIEAGLTTEESEAIVNTVEQESYSPQKQNDGTYACPYCDHIIEKTTKQCPNCERTIT